MIGERMSGLSSNYHATEMSTQILPVSGGSTISCKQLDARERKKLLFGSDGPWLHPGVELYKIRMLKLPVECERLVLCGNAARLILGTHVGRRRSTDYARSTSPRLIRRTRMTTLGERRSYYS
jgi:hypothetical protein